jgi:hypothetical protein
MNLTFINRLVTLSKVPTFSSTSPDKKRRDSLRVTVGTIRHAADEGSRKKPKSEVHLPRIHFKAC